MKVIHDLDREIDLDEKVIVLVFFFVALILFLVPNTSLIFSTITVAVVTYLGQRGRMQRKKARELGNVLPAREDIDTIQQIDDRSKET